jgi:hypothetical protein
LTLPGRCRIFIRWNRKMAHATRGLLLLWPFLGLAFGLAAGTSAFLITYREYERHKLGRKALMRHSLSSALFAFLFFFVSAILIGFAVSYIE